MVTRDDDHDDDGEWGLRQPTTTYWIEMKVGSPCVLVCRDKVDYIIVFIINLFTRGQPKDRLNAGCGDTWYIGRARITLGAINCGLYRLLLPFLVRLRPDGSKNHVTDTARTIKARRRRKDENKAEPDQNLGRRCGVLK